MIRYTYKKDTYKAKYQLLINKRKSADLKYFGDPKNFIEYSSDMDSKDVDNIDDMDDLQMI